MCETESGPGSTKTVELFFYKSSCWSGNLRIYLKNTRKKGPPWCWWMLPSSLFLAPSSLAVRLLLMNERPNEWIAQPRNVAWVVLWRVRSAVSPSVKSGCWIGSCRSLPALKRWLYIPPSSDSVTVQCLPHCFVSSLLR